jgi:histidinol phosphatase-like enzyme/predicted kinase
LARDPLLSEIGAKHQASSAAVALAWLMSFRAKIVPIPGATRVETAASLARARTLTLDDEDLEALDARFSGRLLRVPRAHRRPPDDAESEAVVVMGMPGAGKSVVARALEAQGYQRLNRDAAGGSLSDLVARLDALLAEGERRVVLDNTYPTRKSRNEVIETAWQRGARVRCIWLRTDVGDAQINAIRRMLDVHGALPTPEEIRERTRTDTRYMLPDAQFRYERSLEPPSLDEGFTAIDARDFVRDAAGEGAPALMLDFDDLVEGTAPVLAAENVTVAPERRDLLTRHQAAGRLLFVHAWRPGVGRGDVTHGQVDDCFTRLRAILGVPVDVACCPHEAGPPACWCRKPIPGSVLEFAARRSVCLADSIVVGSSAADRTMAERIGARFEQSTSFFP